ncbi:MAG: DUF1353 domain-containing protein [Agarilytica sp.]
MFLSKPLFRATNNSGEFELVTPCIYFSELKGRIEVTQGLITDFASIPRVFRALVSVNGKHRLAAVVHDFLYMKKGVLPDQNLDRSMCDRVFLEAMKVSGVPFWKRHLMYRAVRVGGWVHWKR